MDYDTICKEIKRVRDFETSKTLDIRRYKEDSPLYPANHVFDENQSVKWNRERVLALNTLTKDILASMRKEIADLYSHLDNMLVQYICDEYGFSQSVALLIFGRSFEEGHSGGYFEVLSCVQSNADFARSVISASCEDEEDVK